MSVEIPIHFTPLWGRGQASPLQRQGFWVLGDRNSDAFHAPTVSEL
ncbi:MAG: hypothetical protein LBQ66_03970 [Planctomycetaceae bacterium]|nr:hypothetical protein [Planctomycetaceae bacterium]